MSESLIKLLTAVFGGTGVIIISYIVSELKEKRKKKIIKEQKDSLLKGLKSISNVYTAMREIQKAVAERVILFEISNGGSSPRPGNKLYAKAVSAKTLTYKNEQELEKKYEKVVVDSNYINMVLQTEQTGLPYLFNVEQHVDCQLKNIYLIENIKYSEIYHIFTDGKRDKMFILSISSKSKLNFLDEIDKAIIDLNIMIIKEEFRKFDEIIL